MKKFTTTTASVAFALTFACVLSCSEQDEPINQSSLAPDSQGNSQTGKKNSTSGRKKSPLDGTIGDPIPLSTAKKWASNYRTENPNATLSHFFGNEIIQQILNQSDCIGIRMYYALNDEGAKQILLVGVGADGEDLIPAEGENLLLKQGDIVADASFPCPDYCPSGGL